MGKKVSSMSPETKQRIRIVLTVVKYCFSLALIILAGSVHGKRYMAAAFLELLIFFALTNLIAGKSRRAGQIVNVILLAFLNIQMALLSLGGSYLSLLMLSNTDSWNDLAGNFSKYAIWVILIIIGTALPITYIKIPHVNSLALLSVGLAGELIFTMAVGNSYSPYYAYADLAAQKAANDRQAEKIAAMGDQSGRFNASQVLDFRKKPDSLKAKQPNIILIFTEGLSQSIVEDSRNIMPNVAAYEKKSVDFSNYYNHTFATYRGIIGQLYSGYQNDNYDENHLTSIQSVLADQGYQTTFINTEPNNASFAAYLERMGFDEVKGEPGLGIYEGNQDYMSDKEAYEALWDTVSEQEEAGKPFFTAIYTFGTHISLGSYDEKFGDGKSDELNKFYNADAQFGAFMDKFENSDISDNTIVVFTADHSTYTDDAWHEEFKNVPRACSDVDRVPFFIYYKGIEPETLDVRGRNSLDLVPTILDYLDISAFNSFLGMSLFSPPDNNNEFDTIFSDPSFQISTKDGLMAPLEGAQKDVFNSNLEAYYAKKLQ